MRWLPLLLAAQAWAHGDLHPQIEDLSRQAQARPRDAELQLRLAELHRLHGGHAEAEARYARALELDPAKVQVWLARGMMALEREKVEEALGHLGRYVELSGDPDGRLRRGKILLSLKRWEKAEEDLQAAWEAHPRPDPGIALDLAACRLARGRPGQALEALDAGLARFGPLLSLEEKAMAIEMEMGSWKEAQERLEASKPLMHESAWRLAAAKLRMAEGRLEDSRREARAGLEAFESLPLPRRRSPWYRGIQDRLSKLAD